MKTPTDMFDAMNSMYKDDLENSTQECEGVMTENIQWLIHKKISSQGAIRSRWRQCQRRRSINCNLEWSSKSSQESCSSRKITYGGMHDWLMAKEEDMTIKP